ncbi:MAG: ATP-dependent DNA helicase RecG [Firmicutes bacterium]|nr:ATP-dependent DNA helicase RecG [Bacillota bacterium]
MDLNCTVSELPNVGEQRAKKLNSMGIYTAKDLLTHFPREYNDRSNICKIKDLVLNEENTFIACVKGQGESIRVKNITFTRIKLYDETGSVFAVWYNQIYMKKAFDEKTQYLFTGKLQKKYGKLEVASPEYEKAEIAIDKIVPIYPSVNGLSQKIWRKLIGEVLEQLRGQLQECLPFWIRKEYLLCECNFAIENIHFPQTQERFFQARRRLVFEEFFLLQLGLLLMKQTLQEGKQGIILQKEYAVEEFEKMLPFTMTNAQKNVLEEIKKDMIKGKVMNRLVQGDVGSGKTAVAMTAAYWTIQNGYQAVLMVPTEVLAEQHYKSFCEMFEPLGIKTVLLSGSLTAKQKRTVLEQIATGEAQMILGTHAVIQKSVVFYKLGLVITDEQHRFGVRQRSALSEKGENPHILVMTATPIPRTLALILYGDLDISIIDELPPGRKKIDTIAVTSAYRERIYHFIKKHADMGLQCYIICPMIEENEKIEVQAVLSYTEALQEGTLKGYRVTCVHGKMKAKEKQNIMEQFSKGEIDVLVSTTVIEVGINVPNAVIMLIENAERFGLAQLHQLRGRVGRGSEKSYCILINEGKNSIAKQRMNVMSKSCDGFIISEMDLKLRGPGEFFGTKQHGLPELKIGNLYKDMSILKEAQKAAETLLQKDKQLQLAVHQQLKQQVTALWKDAQLSI